MNPCGILGIKRVRPAANRKQLVLIQSEPIISRNKTINASSGKETELFYHMKKLLILLTVLALAASPAMAGTQSQKSAKHKQSAKHHVATKHQKKQLKKKLAKRNARQHKVAV